jgi:predicted enzyme related to lactoylglutathione lyase
MPEMTRYDYGVPSWLDLGTYDLDKGVSFYSELFGWEGHDLGADSGHYTIFTKSGKRVAAIWPIQDAGPCRWTTYINVDDVEEVSRKVRSAGGKVVVTPMDVMTAGRMAMFTDTTDTAIAAWQPGQHPGAQLANEPGAFSRSELTSSSPAKSKAFYSAVFGWNWSGDADGAKAQVSDRTVAWLTPRPPGTSADVPDNWLVHFGSLDVDTDVKKAADLGASVLAGPADQGGTGRLAVLADSQGTAFALFNDRTWAEV